MVKRKTRRTATKTRTVYRTVRRARRSTSGTKYIPSMMATAGLIGANLKPISKIAINLRSMKTVTGAVNVVKSSGIVSGNQLVKDGAYVLGGMVAGEALKKYAPGIIKRPLGKIAKKFKGVF